MNLGRTLRAFWYSQVYYPVIWPWRERQREATLLPGPRGERWAERWLLCRGYLILERNCRTKYSEIDLVAVDGQTVVFVEVKSRTGGRAGAAVEAVDDDKQLRLSRAAVAYLRKRQLKQVSVRFDVLAVQLAGDGSQPTVVHYRAAFESALPD